MSPGGGSRRVRRRLLSLTLGASADAAETQRAARAPAPTRRRSSRAAQRPSLCLGARAPAPRRRSYGRRAAEPGGARAARALTLTFAPPPPPRGRDPARSTSGRQRCARGALWWAGGAEAARARARAQPPRPPRRRFLGPRSAGGPGSATGDFGQTPRRKKKIALSGEKKQKSVS